MKKFKWLVLTILSLCIITWFVQIGFTVCGWFDTFLKRSGCTIQLTSAGMVTDLAFAPDGQSLATLSGDRNIRLWNMDKAMLQYTFALDDSSTIYKLVFTPDSANLGVVLLDTIQLWDIDNKTLAATLGGMVFGTEYIAFTSDWTTVALGDSGGGLEIWQLNNNKLLHKLQTSQFSGLYGIRAVAFSPDGTLLASGAVNGSLKLWRVIDGTQLQELQGHTQGIESVAFSPDGSILASGSADNTVRLWRVKDGKEFLVLNRPSYLLFSNQISSVAFSPDGKIIAGGGGNSVQLWRVSDGTLLRTLPHSRAVWDVAFSPDGKIFATTQARGPISLFDVQQMLNQ